MVVAVGGGIAQNATATPGDRSGSSIPKVGGVGERLENLRLRRVPGKFVLELVKLGHLVGVGALALDQKFWYTYCQVIDALFQPEINEAAGVVTAPTASDSTKVILSGMSVKSLGLSTPNGTTEILY